MTIFRQQRSRRDVFFSPKSAMSMRAPVLITLLPGCSSQWCVLTGKRSRKTFGTIFSKSSRTHSVPGHATIGEPRMSEEAATPVYRHSRKRARVMHLSSEHTPKLMDRKMKGTAQPGIRQVRGVANCSKIRLILELRYWKHPKLQMGQQLRYDVRGTSVSPRA
jgi:hypothetical protein